MEQPVKIVEPQPPRHALSVFDAHHPPATERISECVHCGFCLASCPTYRLWGEEADSPRGRIYLMKLGLEGEVELNADYVAHFDRCLGCMACLTSCPSGVKYDQLIEATRAQIERKVERTDSEKLFRRLIFAIFPYPDRLRLLAIPLWFYQRSGLRNLVRRSRLMWFLPPPLRTMDDLAPPVSLRSLLGFAPSPLYSGERVGVRGRASKTATMATISEPPLTPALSPEYGGEGAGGKSGSTGYEISDGAGLRRPGRTEGPSRAISAPTGAENSRCSKNLRVGLLLGCVQRVFFSDVNAATARVLEAEGCEVIVPPGQGCCGALMTHAGEEELAIDFARRTIEAFEEANVDVIAINAAGCGSAMKEYGHLLRDDPAYAKRAAALAAKCRDISEILSSLEPRATRHPLPIRVAFHDACHLQHAQRITSQPRQLLRAIPGVELLEIEDPAICCGSAGIYNLLQPAAAKELGNRKASNILKTAADVVVSGNPGCTLQLRSTLEAAGRSIPVLHWVQLLDASICGTTTVT